MYIYPDNLKGHASLLLWRLWDMVIIVIGIILSMIMLVTTKFVQPLVLTSVFAFLTIRFDDMCIFDYIRNAFKF